MKPDAKYGWLVAEAVEQAQKDGNDPATAVAGAMVASLHQLGYIGRHFEAELPYLPEGPFADKMARHARGVLGAEQWLTDHAANVAANRKGGTH